MVDNVVSGTLLRELYARMLQTRLVDECAWRLHTQGRIHFMARAYGHEAAQVGSAICIEKGTDFTLPYYRDLGVVLTIGMTPYEVFRSYLQTNETPTSSATHTTDQEQCHTNTSQHWGYHKHNIVTGPAPVATQILHAAGIAFAGKLRKAPVVTVAYCGDEATNEPDFHEGLRFAALHQLPAVFIYEHDCNQDERSQQAPIAGPSLPAGLAHQRIDGSDIIAVYTTMSTAMQRTREGNGPLLLEMCCPTNPSLNNDPLRCCQRVLEQQHNWDDAWAEQLHQRIATEVEQAMHDALQVEDRD